MSIASCFESYQKDLCVTEFVLLLRMVRREVVGLVVVFVAFGAKGR